MDIFDFELSEVEMQEISNLDRGLRHIRKVEALGGYDLFA